jgi:putative endonuclease
VGPQKIADTRIGYFIDLFMAIVYILYSNKLSRFYIGFTTLSITERLHQHNTMFYSNKFTGKADDWENFLTIECSSVKQAIHIEKQIKKMKSSKYINNLKKYPEMIDSLRKRFV